ncbi:hypothetical protein [Streptomyces puniciscabiei]|uniref:hypothetical protein n=1 Tax=Streptomyces puniciscabiei TaxID=164348 RepID=UPI0037A6699C
MVDPEFDLLVHAARTDVVFAVVSEIALMVSSVLAVAVGAVVHIVGRKRAGTSTDTQTSQRRRLSAS